MSASASGKSSRKVDLSSAEIEIVLGILRRHRTTIPTYLQSKREEIEIIDGIIEKLSAPR